MNKNSPKTSEIPEASTSSSNVNFGPKLVLPAIVFIYFAAQIVGVLIVALFPLLRGWGTDSTTQWLESSVAARFLTILCVEAVTIWLIWRFLKWRRNTFADIGLVRPKWADIKHILVGIPVYIFSTIVAISLVSLLIPGLDIDQEQSIGFDNARGIFQLFFVFISLVILPPVTEEIATRGFLYSGLKSRWPLWAAAGVTSLLFAAAHLQLGVSESLVWAAAVDTFILSIVLIWLRERSGSLWPPIGLHVLKNAVAFCLLFVVR